MVRTLQPKPRGAAGCGRWKARPPACRPNPRLAVAKPPVPDCLRACGPARRFAPCRRPRPNRAGTPLSEHVGDKSADLKGGTRSLRSGTVGRLAPHDPTARKGARLDLGALRLLGAIVPRLPPVLAAAQRAGGLPAAPGCAGPPQAAARRAVPPPAAAPPAGARSPLQPSRSRRFDGDGG